MKEKYFPTKTKERYFYLPNCPSLLLKLILICSSLITDLLFQTLLSSAKLCLLSDMASQGLCPLIKNILLLDSEGKRVAVKYYSDDWPTNHSKLAFEKFVFSKTFKTNARTEAEVTLLENNIIIYKFVQDLHFFVTGGDDENELILASVLQGFFDAVTLLLRSNVDKREALENLDLILLCLDEIVDGGMILETNGPLIAEKVTSHSLDADAPLSEQTLTQAWATAREHLTRTLLK
ncbi:hypothetical protein ACSQ67_021613 [Phaseolus vulgaris]